MMTIAAAPTPTTYLDWAATALPQPPLPADYRPGNPSSAHGYGRSQRQALAQAKAVLAAEFGCPPEEVVATGGATEADHLVLYSPLASLQPDTRAPFDRGIVVSAVEHPAVAEPAAPAPADRVSRAHGTGGRRRDDRPRSSGRLPG